MCAFISYLKLCHFTQTSVEMIRMTLFYTIDSAKTSPYKHSVNLPAWLLPVSESRKVASVSQRVTLSRVIISNTIAFLPAAALAARVGARGGVRVLTCKPKSQVSKRTFVSRALLTAVGQQTESF